MMINDLKKPHAASETSPASTTAPRPIMRRWAGLVLLSLPTALLGLDVTLLYLALPVLAEDLQPTTTQALWIMDIYAFMITGFLISMGALGDRIGRRRLLVTGSFFFGLASLLAAFSTSPTMLIGARAVLGIAGATLMPSTLSLISNLFTDHRERSFAIGIWASTFSLGMALGPLIGGMLLERFWWGAAFLVAIPVVLAVLLGAPFLLPEYKQPVRGPIDLASIALSLGSILSLTTFVKEAARHGLGVVALATLTFGVVIGVLFVRRQTLITHPLLDLSLFANTRFTAALVILFVGPVSVGGTMLLVTQYLQLVLDLPPIVAGFWMAPPALIMIFAGIAAPLLARRIRRGLLIAGALALSALGYMLLAFLPMLAGALPVVLGFSIIYFGIGTVGALGTDIVVDAAPANKTGSASALSETAQELGVAVGVAVLGSLAAAVYRVRMEALVPPDLPSELAERARDSLWSTKAIAETLPPNVTTYARAAFVSGMSISAIVAMSIIATLAFLAARLLRDVGVIGGER